MVGSRVGIIIPALNEQEAIGQVLSSIAGIGVIIVVNDGSIDETASIAKMHGAYVVTHDKRQGYDAAINSGFKKAYELGIEVVITMDADGQHDVSAIKKLIEMHGDGYDLVVAVRDIKSRISEKLFGCIFNFLFLIPDPMSGLKVYKTTLFNELGHFDSYGSIGTELLVYALSKKYRVGVMHFSVRPRIDASRFRSSFFTNLKITRALIIGLYKFYLLNKKGVKN